MAVNMERKTLNQIGVERGTDKSSLNHHYLSLYDMLFDPMRDQDIRILEIGVQFGNSLRTWREYFPSAGIVGIDSIDNDVKFNPMDGVNVIIGDAYNDRIFERLVGKFDIIIDDGSHEMSHQIFFVKHYCDLLTDEGLLIVEDVLTPNVIPELIKALPPDFSYISVDMTEGDSVVDSRLFIAHRKYTGTKSVTVKSVQL